MATNIRIKNTMERKEIMKQEIQGEEKYLQHYNLKSPHYPGDIKINVLLPLCLSLESPRTNRSKRQILSVCEQLLGKGTNPFSSFIQYFRS